MGSLEDALRKSGLVSKKQAKQARHQKRVHRTEVGRDGLEAERREKERLHREEQEKRREADQRLESERSEKEAAIRETKERERFGSTSRSGGGDEPDGAASLDTIESRIYRGTLGRTGGPKQYFFVLAGGQIRHLEVNDDTFRRLQDGGAGIVLVPTPAGEAAARAHFAIVDRETALQVRSVIPDCLVELQSERSFGGRR